MLTKNQIKLISSLVQKKQRQKQGLFVVEGKKSVNEFLASSFILHQVYTSNSNFIGRSGKTTVVSDQELSKISALSTAQEVVGVFQIPHVQDLPKTDLILALDDVRDPGNLGTIIRLCDWFGIDHLVCSETTVDCYNPKVVQATMGSLTRVTIHYTNLKLFLETAILPKYGTFMDGASIYKSQFPKEGILVMGNEANGISSEIEHLIDGRIGIPSFSNHQATESLNVATATAILLSEFKRAKA